MQTFITHVNVAGQVKVCADTAACLDTARLGKQRVECKQIYSALTTGVGWIHHPATKMWEGCPDALCTYAHLMCQEWRARGFEDTLGEYFYDLMPDFGIHDEDWPWWFGHPEMVRTHRSKLIRKAPSHYKPLFHRDRVTGLLTVPGKYALPYIWPDAVERNGFRLSAAEAKRMDWQIPGHWYFETQTRKVVFDA